MSRFKQAAKRVPIVFRISQSRGWWLGMRGVCSARSRWRFALYTAFPALAPSHVELVLVDGERVHIRWASSDAAAFWQVFMLGQYDLPDGLVAPRLIVDAGANIGMTSLFYARRHPAATIVALEPDPENFAMLCKNTGHRSNIVLLEAALWHEHVALRVEGGAGTWDARMAEAPDGTVRAVTIVDVMEVQGATRIDLLKLDIEGGERDVLLHSSAWIDAVDAIAVELHAGAHPDCGEVFDAVTDGFGTRFARGEITLVRR